MRVECPACNTAYEVPEAKLSPGLAVRCARCGSDWTPIPAPPAVVPPVAMLPVADELAPPAPVVPPPAPLPPEPEPVAAPDAPRPRGRALLVLAWVASLAVVAGALVALVLAREPVMRAWPPSVRAYAALGLLRH